MNKKRGLGRGLSSLIPAVENEDETVNGEKFCDIPLSKIVPNPNQPRQRMDEQNLAELIESIKIHGLIQPIVVRPAKKTGYEIVAGERRWLACKKLNLEHVPAIIKNYSDLEASAAALIENIQRENLNVLEEAGAYKKLMNNHGLTQEDLSGRLGKSRSYIANMIRLLALPEEIKILLSEGGLTAGHARALLSLNDAEMQIKLAARIIDRKISVRETEQMVRKLLAERAGEGKEVQEVDQEKKNWEKRLTGRLGRAVRIRQKSDGSGALVIRYNNTDDFIFLLEKLALK